MKAAELRKLVKENKEWCVEQARLLPTPILEKMARVIFPAGTLPNESNPRTFTERELVIIRELIFRTEKMENKVLRAKMVMSGMKQGMTFSDV